MQMRTELPTAFHPVLSYPQGYTTPSTCPKSGDAKLAQYHNTYAYVYCMCAFPKKNKQLLFSG